MGGIIGKWEFYFANGNLKESRVYKNGEPTGVWQKFNSNGKLVLVRDYLVPGVLKQNSFDSLGRILFKNESEYDIISNYSWGESRILSTDDEGEDVYITIDELIKDTDMGEWSNLNDLIDSIKESAYNKVFSNCGFGIWWQ